jgi:serine/threonine protein kinase
MKIFRGRAYGSQAQLVEEAFKTELEANGYLRSHKRTVPLLNAFKHGEEEFRMIFPWADGGNLLQLWHATGRVKPDTAEVSWFFDQCIGLAEAVAATHARYVLHADIKPENVLCFSSPPADDGTGGEGTRTTSAAAAGSPLRLDLRLADFGISKFVGGKDQTVDNELRPQAPTYRAPEFNVDLGGVGLKADIWSLGCLYLDFTTWLLLGNNSRRKFEDRRVDEHEDNFLEDVFFKVEETREPQAVKKAVVKKSVSKVGAAPLNSGLSPGLRSLQDLASCPTSLAVADRLCSNLRI